MNEWMEWRERGWMRPPSAGICQRGEGGRHRDRKETKEGKGGREPTPLSNSNNPPRKGSPFAFQRRKSRDWQDWLLRTAATGPDPPLAVFLTSFCLFAVPSSLILSCHTWQNYSWDVLWIFLAGHNSSWIIVLVQNRAVIWTHSYLPKQWGPMGKIIY